MILWIRETQVSMMIVQTGSLSKSTTWGLALHDKDSQLLSIVIPVYQNAASINDTCNTLTDVCRKANIPFELVLVDDGSTDDSFLAMKQYAEHHDVSMKLVKLTKTFGQTQATKTGIQATTGACVVIISADLQDPPELIPEMYSHWQQGSLFVLAERTDRFEGKAHTFFSNLYWKMISRFAIKNFPKGGYDYCLIDGRVRDTLNSFSEKNTSIFPLIFWLGFQPTIIPYKRMPRKSGRSQWTLLKKVQLVFDTFFNFTYLPVRLISSLGITASLFALLYAFFLLFRWIFYGGAPEGWTSIALLISIFGCLILFCLGIIGEYLWRILDESRPRPNIIVEEYISHESHRIEE